MYNLFGEEDDSPTYDLGSIHLLPMQNYYNRCCSGRRQCFKEKTHQDKEKKEEMCRPKKVLKTVITPWEESVDMADFAEDEITIVKVGKRLIIQGVKTEKAPGQGWGYSKKELVRSVDLPHNLVVRSIQTKLAEDGHLKISGKKVETSLETVQERVVPIMTSTPKESSEALTKEEEVSKKLLKESESEELIESTENDKSLETSADQTSATRSTETEVKSEDQQNSTPSQVTEVLTTDSTDIRPFDVSVEVPEFTPEEISVKSDGNSLLVVADHKEESEGFFVKRHVERRYPLPGGVSVDALHCALSKEGTLTISSSNKKEENDTILDIAMETKSA